MSEEAVAAAWTPTPELAATSNVGRFMAAHGFDDFEALRRRSIDDPEWFWDAIVQFLRAWNAWPVVIGSADIPVGASWVAFLGALLLAVLGCIAALRD